MVQPGHSMVQIARRQGMAAVAAGLIGAACAVPITLQAAQPQGTPPPASAGQAAQTLPGGASQLQETHGDWRVVCVQQDGTKVCALSQQQVDSNSRQLVLGIELKPVDGRAEGTLILPFGLAVTKPVTLQVDEAGATQTVAFRTCIPTGCLVPVTFEVSTTASLRKGKALSVKATGDGSQETSLQISLNGFGSALDRTADLVK